MNKEKTMIKQQIHGWITAARPRTLPAALTLHGQKTVLNCFLSLQH